MATEEYKLVGDRSGSMSSSSGDESDIKPSRRRRGGDTQHSASNRAEIQSSGCILDEKYPCSVWFILGNEVCERFSYYGIHTILVLYLTSMLKMDNERATAIYHAFNMFCYFSPLFGAIIADSFLGKYKTILYVSIIYGIGNIIVAVTAVPSILNSVKLAGPMVGLLLIALGTGGIKPCVSAFGGDQFGPNQQHLLESFFSIFYFSINFGSLLSMIVTPVLRGDVSCFGNDCYSLAFGVPAGLMIISIIVFVAGTPRYKRNPPSGNVVVQVISCIFHAARRRCSSVGRRVAKQHWLDWAEDKYSKAMVSDVKALLRVLFMFLPLPLFWTLFDQQGSRWTLQAELLDGHIGDLLTIKPDQMQALNPIFILVLIPIFERILYPIMRKCGFALRPLQRMCFGMFLASISFLMAAFLQLNIQATTIRHHPAPFRQSNLRVINAARCSLNVTFAKYPSLILNIPQRSASDYLVLPSYVNEVFVRADKCPQSPTLAYFKKEEVFPLSLVSKKSFELVISNYQGKFSFKQFRIKFLNKIKSGTSRVRFIHAGAAVVPKISIKLNSTFSIKNLTRLNATQYLRLKSERYDIEVIDGNTNKVRLKEKIEFENSGMYTVIVQGNPVTPDNPELILEKYVEVSAKTVPMFWQIPQYLAITSAEVMFSITGLEFAYSQSPPSMKSCIMAAWLLTVSVGNLIVVIFAEARFFYNMAYEFFFFAGLLVVVVIIFAVMAQFYTYVCEGSMQVNELNEDNQILLEETEDDNG
ncbi:solute carrier family 15 member 2-like [Dendronephthya gigantea]|uniref:solute carrier family 15 member 2-like n=1 Tax=Dendronephthya gigantea TaxID=151771 RepID=UPI00106B0861|nr:solute carrier family 15 member 2-like [Dendronephthya gigantea]XP_028409002.1 solute carrier family 15 member 2-like [Dendronephthya gigantea]